MKDRRGRPKKLDKIQMLALRSLYEAGEKELILSHFGISERSMYYYLKECNTKYPHFNAIALLKMSLHPFTEKKLLDAVKEYERDLKK